MISSLQYMTSSVGTTNRVLDFSRRLVKFAQNNSASIVALLLSAVFIVIYHSVNAPTPWLLIAVIGFICFSVYAASCAIRVQWCRLKDLAVQAPDRWNGIKIIPYYCLPQESTAAEVSSTIISLACHQKHSMLRIGAKRILVVGHDQLSPPLTRSDLYSVHRHMWITDAHEAVVICEKVEAAVDLHEFKNFRIDVFDVCGLEIL